jgi:hypothetical protein
MATRKKGKKKGNTRKKKTSTTPERRAARGDKFHGIIEVETPEGSPVADNNRVLIALRSIEFGDIPDFTRENEVSLSTIVETDKKEDGQATGSFKVELLKYVKDDHKLNIRDLVIFSGPVHGYVTLRCAIDELDRSTVEKQKELITQTLGLAKDLAPEGPAKTLLGGLPGVLGALLSFNDDDQVLVLNHTLYTGDVLLADESRRLRTGLYTFTKKESEDAEAQVTIVVDVLAHESS